MRTETSAEHAAAVVYGALTDELRSARARGVQEPRVVDVGGGSGTWAVPFAAAGCRVTVVDPNPNVLATLRRRASEEGVAERVTAVADDSDALGARIPEASADLILAHGLLEVVDDPRHAVASLATVLAPTGALSVLAANRYAAALQRALAGRLTEARGLLRASNGVLRADGETLLRRFGRTDLEELMSASGLRVTSIRGDGVASDVVADRDAESRRDDTDWDAELGEFERDAASVPELRDVASRLHLLAHKPGDTG